MTSVFRSLREASLDTGIPEKTLRRHILLGKIIARPVPDDREYLIPPHELERLGGGSVSVPVPRHRKGWIKIVFRAVLLTIVSATLLGYCFPVYAPRPVRALYQLILSPPGPAPNTCPSCEGAVLGVGYGLRGVSDDEMDLGDVILRDGTRVDHLRYKGQEYFAGG